MLRYIVRRMLWALPSVLALSLVAFYLLSFLPRRPQSVSASTETVRQSHYDRLPLFINTRPRDLQIRVEQLLTLVDGAETNPQVRTELRKELEQVGGAALPLLLPRLDSFSPAKRRVLALQLQPLAQRMGLRPSALYQRPDQVVLAWQRFWQIHRVEFSPLRAKRIIKRYGRYGTEARANEARLLDTYLLPALFRRLALARDNLSNDEMRRLVDLVADMTRRNDRIAGAATRLEANSCVDRWLRWWMVHQNDYRQLSGIKRAGALVVETQYGKWALEAVALQLGRDFRGRPIAEQWRVRLPVTLSITLFGLGLAYSFGVVAGALAAWRREGALDRLIEALTLVLQLLTPVGLIAFSLLLAPDFDKTRLLAALLLAACLLAEPTRHTRLALGRALVSDTFEAARARGAGPFRLMFIHGKLSLWVPLLSRLSVELPTALTLCFVLEYAFGLPGLGPQTIAAVRHGDVSWLMTIAIFGALCATTALVFSDAATAALDPRMRRVLVSSRKRLA